MSRYYFLCIRYCSCNLGNNARQVLFIILVYIRGNGGTERLSGLATITGLNLHAQKIEKEEKKRHILKRLQVL